MVTLFDAAGAALEVTVPACTATPPLGRSFAMIVPVSATAGVAGVAVVPPCTYACVLSTRFEYVSGCAFGLTAMENDAEPVQRLLSVAVTVKVNVPGAVGVPGIVPLEASERPVGNVPPMTANVYGAWPPEAMKLWPA